MLIGSVGKLPASISCMHRYRVINSASIDGVKTHRKRKLPLGDATERKLHDHSIGRSEIALFISVPFPAYLQTSRFRIIEVFVIFKKSDRKWFRVSKECGRP